MLVLPLKRKHFDTYQLLRRIFHNMDKLRSGAEYEISFKIFGTLYEFNHE